MLRLLVSLSSVVVVLSVFGEGAGQVAGQRPAAAIEESSDKPDAADDGQAALGKRLFNDPVLSSNERVSCGTCHLPANGYGSPGLPAAIGGGTLLRRAPSILNRGNSTRLFWDGRADSLATQAREVLTNAREMGNRTVAEATARANRKLNLRLTDDSLIAAIVAYEKTLTSPPNRHDEYLKGKNALGLTASEARGWELFRGDANCYKCHTGRLFTDDKLHDTGTGGRWKTSGLRQCGTFGGFMHDARFKTLEDVVEHYAKGGGEAKKLGLTKEQKTDLVAFLRSL